MINIKYFAKYRELLDMTHEAYALTAASDLAMLKIAIALRHPEAVTMLQDPRCIVAVNQLVVVDNMPLKSGDEVAFFPPVTGG